MALAFFLGIGITLFTLNLNIVDLIFKSSPLVSVQKDTFEDKSKGLVLRSCDMQESLQKVINATVRIISENGEGSGFVIDNSGFIVTNYHVIYGYDAFKIVFPDKTSVIGTLHNWDEQSDLAIIRVNKDVLTNLAYGDSNTLKVGEDILGVGYPLGSVLPGDATVTKGILSAKRESNTAGVEFLQIDGNFNKGNSGGPIVNKCGEVVGILNSGIDNTEGIKFAISSRTAKDLTKSLISTGPKVPKWDKRDQALADDSTLLYPVMSFYAYISTRNIDLAYDLLSKNFKKEAGNLNDFINGYKNTLNVFLQDLHIEDSSSQSVYVKLASADLEEDKVVFKFYEGTWMLAREDGKLKLDKANIHELK